MKTTKIILLFALGMALFSGCSNEESFIEEKTESLNTAKGGIEMPDTTNIINIIVEYNIGVTQVEKTQIRNQYFAINGFINYIECVTTIGNDKDTWIVNGDVWFNPQILWAPKEIEMEGEEDIDKVTLNATCQ